MSPVILAGLTFNGRGHLGSLLGNMPKGYDFEALPVLSKNKIDDDFLILLRRKRK